MELKLNKEEVQLALLQWVAQKFPGEFNQVHFEGYSYSNTATFTYDAPVVEVASE